VKEDRQHNDSVNQMNRKKQYKHNSTQPWLKTTGKQYKQRQQINNDNDSKSSMIKAKQKFLYKLFKQI